MYTFEYSCNPFDDFKCIYLIFKCIHLKIKCMHLKYQMDIFDQMYMCIRKYFSDNLRSNASNTGPIHVGSNK